MTCPEGKSGDRRYDRVEITFARPSGIIGVHLYAGTKVPSTSSAFCAKGEISQRGTLAQVVQDLSPRKAASTRPCSGSFRPLFHGEVQPALPTEAENIVHVRRARETLLKLACARFLTSYGVLFV